MTAEIENVYILGAGAVGLALAVQLASNGKRVTAVRTSDADTARTAVEASVQRDASTVTKAEVEMVSLAKLDDVPGLIVVTAKSYANTHIAGQLKEKRVTAPIILMQNGLGVEAPYLDAGFPQLYRCILYMTSQKTDDYGVSFRAISPSPVGVIEGSRDDVQRYVDHLSTPEFPFRVEDNIQEESWKKAIMNSVFNSICPLLEVDNGIFARDEDVVALAGEIVEECLGVSGRLGMGLGREEIMDQIMRVSRGSGGQLISTLQDIQAGRETEIDSLNLEIAKVAKGMAPPVDVRVTELLGRLILMKSQNHRKGR